MFTLNIGPLRYARWLPWRCSFFNLGVWNISPSHNRKMSLLFRFSSTKSGKSLSERCDVTTIAQVNNNNINILKMFCSGVEMEKISIILTVSQRYEIGIR